MSLARFDEHNRLSFRALCIVSLNLFVCTCVDDKQIEHLRRFSRPQVDTLHVL